MSKLLERFLGYVKYDTQSDEASSTLPSTKSQLEFGKILLEELKTIGMSDVKVDEMGFVTATLPSNMEKEVPTIGFLAHMDTAPDYSGKNVNPKIIENYGGEDIKLNENTTLSVKDFPEIKKYVGKTIITTDGTTLLGGDDKAGIAEIMTAMEYLINNPEIKHGAIRVAFTPDEEIGTGCNNFDVPAFNADFAYTLDGGEVGEISYETFNAAGAVVTFNGVNVHPGSAKGKMKHSGIIAMEFFNELPENQRPETTEGYDGFFMLTDMNVTVEKSVQEYIIRDFDMDKFKAKKATMEALVKKYNEKYGEGTVVLDMSDTYYNMAEKIKEQYHIVETAVEAIKSLEIEALVLPIRGGTDGSKLSFKGLPTPNLFTGGHNFHGKFEYIVKESMESAVQVVLKIIELYANK
ncbi:peptidase T [Clostridium senegalense]|uniref:peptidase T n=1 Tax=Clostridium senegalense TaxID=1465809 RepID=UPI001C116EA1|nr:peptidase T [Clostridium senegalense]MBU5228087.1 peptidase T [Clostridium senegalense]